MFPNLFPLAKLHAVVTYPERHFLRPSDFAPDLLQEGLGAAVELCGRAEALLPGPGASGGLLQPHAAGRRQPGAPALPGLRRPGRAVARADCCGTARRPSCSEHGVSYWEALVEQETAAGERFIADRDGVTWLVPFAPIGGREVIAVVPGRARVADLGRRPGRPAGARPLREVVAWYEREGLSAFNFTLYGGPLAGDGSGHPVVLRVIARTAFKPDYRTDDYFLQKQLGGELIFSPPEQIAATLRDGLRPLLSLLG